MIVIIKIGVLCQKATSTAFVCPVEKIPYVSNVSFLSYMDTLKNQLEGVVPLTFKRCIDKKVFKNR